MARRRPRYSAAIGVRHGDGRRLEAVPRESAERRPDRHGAATAEVAALMRHGPERREARLRVDGQTVEEWHYMTDVVRKRDTTVTFLGDHVVEIRTTPWADVD